MVFCALEAWSAFTQVPMQNFLVTFFGRWKRQCAYTLLTCEGDIHMWELCVEETFTCGSYSHVEGAYSHVGVTHMWRGYSHVGVTHMWRGHSCVGVTHMWRGHSRVEVTHMCGTSHLSEILHSLIFSLFREAQFYPTRLTCILLQ